jgi:hypothetical protein
MEVAGGSLGTLVRRMPVARRFVALTLGHIVLGRSHDLLEGLRAHEHAHVRQYERWGLLLFPLYVVSGAVQIVRGRNPYWHNVFERQARAAAAGEPPADSRFR